MLYITYIFCRYQIDNEKIQEAFHQKISKDVKIFVFFKIICFFLG